MLVLKVRGTSGVMSLEVKESSTFGALRKQIADALHFASVDAFDILAGFPPTAIAFSDNVIIMGHIKNNESVRVQAKELAGLQAQGHTPAPSKITKKANKAKAAPVASSSGFGARIASLHSAPTSSSRSSSSANRAPVPRGTIAGLNTSSRVSSSRKRQTRINVNDVVKDESDIAIHLMSAVNGGSGKRDKTLRKVFRNAVEYQYNSTKAVARMHAIFSGDYEIEEVSTSRILNTGMSSQITITFTRGAGNRGQFTETVDYLSEPLLKELLKLALQDEDGAGREVLKPMNLSRCSPRIFWSLVHRYGPNLISTIRTLLTGIDDCAWLTERKRELSEKAKENQAQELAKKATRDAKKRRRDDMGEESKMEEEQLPSSSSQAAAAAASKAKARAKFAHLFDSFDYEEIIPEDHLAAVQELLQGSKSLLSLAASTEIEVIAQAVSCSVDEVDTWVHQAQQLFMQVLWQHVICGGGCERLLLALHQLRIRTPAELLIWKASPMGLFQALIQGDSALASITFIWPENDICASSGWTPQHVQFMSAVCEDLMTHYGSWMKQFQEIVDFSQQAETAAAVAEGSGSSWEDDWQMDATCHEYIGKRCRVVVRSEDNEDEAEEDEADDEEDDKSAADMKLPTGAYWEDGTVMAYLPPTEEEPMALWRVRLDENPKLKKKGAAAEDNAREGRFEDMEEHEVELAMARYPAV